MRATSTIRWAVVASALYAAVPVDDRAEPGSVAVLLDVGQKATVSLSNRSDQKISAVTGQLIPAGARLMTGGEPLRFVFLPDGYTWEYISVPRSYPAPPPSHRPVDRRNEQFEVRFLASTPMPGDQGKLERREKWPVRFGRIELDRMLLAGDVKDSDLSALKEIDAELGRPGNGGQPALHLAKAIALERADELRQAAVEYRALEQKWVSAAWLNKKILDLQSATQAEEQRAALRSRPGRRYAIAIGISEYQRLPRLPYAAADATLFADYAASSNPAGRDGKSYTLVDGAATRAAVRNLIDEVLSKEAGPNDTVLLFYSGYGMSEKQEDGEQGFLLQSDSDPQEKRVSSYSLAELEDTVRTKSRGARIILFADLCRASSYQGNPNSINAIVARELPRPRIAGILAPEISRAASDSGGGHGVFATQLVKGLRGDAHPNGQVTFDDLFAYLDRAIRPATNSPHVIRFGTPPPTYVFSASRRFPGMTGGTENAEHLLPGGNSLYERSIGLFASARPPRMLLPQAIANPGTQAAGFPAPAGLGPENEGQQLILLYLRGNETSPGRSVFETGEQKFDEANRQNPSPGLEARRLFFEGRKLTFDDDARAIPLLESALRLDPAAGYAYNALGIAYLKQARFDDAAACFRDAILRAPHWIYPRNNLALTYMQAGAYDSAEKEYRAAIRLEGETASLHYGLGLLLQRTNRNREAGEEYQRTIRINPNLAEAHNGLGTVLAALGKRRQAVDEYNAALRLNERLSPARHDLGLLYAREKNYSEAIAAWTENIKLDPKFLESRLSLADVYARTAKGDRARYDAAIEQYEAVLGLSPGYQGAERALDETQGDSALARMDKTAAAAEYAKALKLAVEDEDRSRIKKKLKRAQK